MHLRVRLRTRRVQATGSPFPVGGANYVALDPSGNAWVTSTSGGVQELSGAGSNLTCTACGDADIVNPAAIAVDGSGVAFTANMGGAASLLGLLGTTGDVGKISGPGTAYSFYYSQVVGDLLNQIPAVSQAAVDSAGYVWVSGDGASCNSFVCGGLEVQRISGSSFTVPATSVLAGNYFCFFGCSVQESPEGIAIDAAGNAWIAVSGGIDKISTITPGGFTVSYTGGGLAKPQGIAVDGASNLFVANSNGVASSISAFTNAGFALSGSGGYGSTAVAAPTALDVDESGDVWVVSPGSGGYVTEFIGIATPVVRPLSAAAGAGKLGATP